MCRTTFKVLCQYMEGVDTTMPKHKSKAPLASGMPAVQRNYLIKSVAHLEQDKVLLQSELDLGMILIDGARDKLEVINNKQFQLKEKLVLACHIRQDGLPRSIHHHSPTDIYKTGYWVTKMPDGSKPKAVQYEDLIDTLFSYYSNGLKDYTFESVFKAALHEKEITENPNENTLIKNRADFYRFFDENFRKHDIRAITESILKQYTQEWVNDNHPKKKLYYAYKGILKLIFDFGLDKGIVNADLPRKLKNKAYIKSCDTRKPKPEEKILSPAEIDSLIAEIRHRMTLKKWGPYYINGLAALFSIETGVRVGELCSLKWVDIKDTEIHIHSQQLVKMKNGHKSYYYDHHTKNEKGLTEEGRYFPLTSKIRSLLSEISNLQKELGIKSEYIFCNRDGEWIKKDSYISFLRRLCKSKGFKVTNNHAFRMSLNCNVFIPAGMDDPMRAALLGHSIETNLRDYTFARKGYVTEARQLLDDVRTPMGPQKIVSFTQKEKPQNTDSSAFQG
ncbi:MAG: phage integrase family protein [Butyrivibrio sp.]|nr:phage integrase family protein [Butyrivibrio sp.]